MKTFVFISFTILAAFHAQAQHSARPNIIYILADDMGIGDAQCYNPDGKIATPHTDKMAAQGMRFTDAHSGSAVCTPTRYGILTGRYAWRSKLQKGVLNGYSAPLVDTSRLTVPQLLKNNGYHTAIIGKWHLGMTWTMNGKTPDFTQPLRHTPLSNGFDEYFGISASLDMPPYVFIKNDRLTELPTDSVVKGQYPNTRPGPKGPGFVFEHTLQTLAGKTQEYIREHKKQPFFLYLALPSPHTPLVAGAAFKGKSGICNYADYVMETDWLLGQVMSYLKDEGLTENTLLIFTSDNGYAPYAEYDRLKAAGHDPSGGFRGAKADLYEGGHRIPFIVRWPGKVKAGAVNDVTICLTDLMATCAAIVGQPLPPAAGPDSFSLLPLLQGYNKRYARTSTVHHSISGHFAIRQGDWKLLFSPGSGGWSDPRDPAARQQGLPELQLFNLRTDKTERHNLQSSQPAVVARLTALLKETIGKGRSTPGPVQANDAKIDMRKERS
jgi:arylsulfatase A-like enzyme